MLNIKANLWRHLAQVCLIFTVLVTASGQSSAGTFTVSAVNITMPARQPSFALTVKNESTTDPLSIQMDTYSWKQTEVEDQYDTTKDLLVSPKVFTVPAGGSQIVRLALRNKIDSVDELAFRLFVKEILPEVSTSQSGVRIALQMNIPVFVVPALPDKSALEVTYTKSAGSGKEVLTLSNPGTIHKKLTGIRVVADEQKRVIEKIPTVITLLPKSKRALTVSDLLEPGQAVPQSLTVRVEGEGPAFEKQLKLDSR